VYSSTKVTLALTSTTISVRPADRPPRSAVVKVPSGSATSTFRGT
jgi:hypothetical protein